MINFIKNIFLKKEPIFKLRIEESWFSNDYVVMQWTINGRKWNTIQHFCDYPIDYGMRDLTFSIENRDNFDDEMKQFSTLEKVIQFEKDENIKYLQYCNKLKKEEDEKEIRRKKLFENTNK